MMIPHIAYYLEALPGRRAILRADLVCADGTIVASYCVGSPAPREAVERFLEGCG
jgi:hypothetical protein